MLLLGDRPLATGDALDVTADGLTLVLRVPAGRRLQSASLSVCAIDAASVAVVPRRRASQLGDFPASAPVRWASLELEGERPVTAITLGAAPGDMARIKLFGRGIWAPLQPTDLIVAGAEQSFPAMAASRVMAEMLVPNDQQVPVPGALVVRDMAVKATGQPCQLALAVSQEAPFFSASGPLPTRPVEVYGLLRAASRFLLDTPGASEIPLRLTAAGSGTVCIAAWSADLVKQAAEPRTGAGATPAPALPSTVVDASPFAQLCGEGHEAARRVLVPPGQALAQLALWGRCGPTPLAGQIGLHADTQGCPAEQASDVAPIDATPAPRSPGWLVARPLRPIALPGGAFWVVCRMTRGEFLWYRSQAENELSRARVDGGPWQALLPPPGALLTDLAWLPPP